MEGKENPPLKDLERGFEPEFPLGLLGLVQNLAEDIEATRVRVCFWYTRHQLRSFL